MRNAAITMLVLVSALARSAHADTEIIVGGITEHIFFGRPADQVPYSNGIGDGNNLINNRLLGVRFNDVENLRPTFFAGTNSVGKPMVGGLLSPMDGDISPVIGGYFQSMREFEKRGLIVPTLIPPINGVGLMPVTGVELSHKFRINRSNYIRPIVILTPALITLNVGIGF